MPAFFVAGILLSTLSNPLAIDPGPLHGADAAIELQTYRQELLNESPRPSRAEYQSKVKAKALEILATIELDKIVPTEGAEWAKVYTAAERYQDSFDVLERFVATKPDAHATFLARQSEFQDVLHGQVTVHGKVLKPIDIIKETKPTDVKEARFIAVEATQAAEQIDASKHLKDALSILDQTSGLLAGFPASQKAIVGTKANLLIENGKEGDAKKLLATALKGQDQKDPDLRSLVYLNNLLNLNGNLAPELGFTEKYGDFTNLAALKGKVVVLDFFAHWCPPCKASFPDMRKLTDDLGPSVAAIGVTSYYGYFGTDRGLSKPEEFARMKGFLDQYKIDHPVIYVDKSEFAAYGVSGIPEFVLINKQGKVVDYLVGYDAPSFAKFRARVEAAAKE